ncbi:hypothetical protein ECZU03_15240 [Escherichia coli]|nr:hypothetical protein ECZU03_15240 [Escherichia coli]
MRGGRWQRWSGRGYLALVETYLAQEPAAFHVDLLAAHYRHDAGLLGAALLAQGEKL